MNNINISQRKVTQIKNIHFDELLNNSQNKTTIQTSHIKNLSRKKHMLANESFTRNLSININHFSFIIKRDVEHVVKKTKYHFIYKTYTSYHDFMSLNQVESIIIVYDSKYQLFAIKKYTINSIMKTNFVYLLRRNEFVIALLNVYTLDTHIYMMYECINVTLKHVLTTSKRQLKMHEITIICRKVCVFVVE